MSWRRFCVLVAGLSFASLYRYATSEQGKAQRPLTAEDAPAFFASFRKGR